MAIKSKQLPEDPNLKVVGRSGQKKGTTNLKILQSNNQQFVSSQNYIKATNSIENQVSITENQPPSKRNLPTKMVQQSLPKINFPNFPPVKVEIPKIIMETPADSIDESYERGITGQFNLSHIISPTFEAYEQTPEREKIANV